MQQRPPLLKIGIIATVIYAVFYIALLVLAGLIGTGALTIAAIEELHDEEILFAGLGGGLLCCFLGFFVLLNAVKLLACYGAWQLNRTWLIILATISGVSLILETISQGGSGMWCCLPISAIVNILTLIGCVQAIQRAD